MSQNPKSVFFIAEMPVISAVLCAARFFELPARKTNELCERIFSNVFAHGYWILFSRIDNRCSRTRLTKRFFFSTMVRYIVRVVWRLFAKGESQAYGVLRKNIIRVPLKNRKIILLWRYFQVARQPHSQWRLKPIYDSGAHRKIFTLSYPHIHTPEPY